MTHPTARPSGETDSRGDDAAFMAGFAMACADLVRDRGMPAIAAGLIAGHGFKMSDFKTVDEYDRKVIRKLFREESEPARAEPEKPR